MISLRQAARLLAVRRHQPPNERSVALPPPPIRRRRRISRAVSSTKRRSLPPPSTERRSPPPPRTGAVSGRQWCACRRAASTGSLSGRRRCMCRRAEPGRRDAYRSPPPAPPLDVAASDDRLRLPSTAVPVSGRRWSARTLPLSSRRFGQAPPRRARSSARSLPADPRSDIYIFRGLSTARASRRARCRGCSGWSSSSRLNTRRRSAGANVRRVRVRRPSRSHSRRS